MAEIDDLKTQNAVIASDIGRIKADIKEIKEAQAKFMDKCVSDERFQLLEDRVKKTETNLDWAVKIVLGSVILAVIGLVLRQGGVI